MVDETGRHENDAPPSGKNARCYWQEHGDPSACEPGAVPGTVPYNTDQGVCQPYLPLQGLRGSIRMICADGAHPHTWPPGQELSQAPLAPLAPLMQNSQSSASTEER